MAGKTNADCTVFVYWCEQQLTAVGSAVVNCRWSLGRQLTVVEGF